MADYNVNLDNPCQYVSAKWDSIKSSRASLETKWRLLWEMLQGRHYLRLDRASGVLRDYPPYASPKRRVRTTRNHILRFYSAVLARLTSQLPNPCVNPSNLSIEAVTSAILARMLCLEWLESSRLVVTNIRAHAYAVAFGKGYVKTLWDDQAGPVNQQTGKPDGDVRFEAISPFNIVFYPENVQFAYEARGSIEARLMPVDEVERIYGIRPKKLFSAGDANYMPLMTGGGSMASDSGGDKMCLVKELMELPSPQFKGGLHIITAGDEAIPDQEGGEPVGPFPYEKLATARELPYAEVWYRYITDNPNGRGLLIDLAQPQMDYNRLRSQEIEFRNAVAGGGRVLLPNGCGIQVRDWNDESAGPITYNLLPNGTKPEVMQMPRWDSAAEQTAMDCLGDMADVASHHEARSGKVPRNIESGVAIEALQEADDLPLITGSQLTDKLGLSAALRHGLILAQSYYDAERVLSAVGPNGIPFYYEGFSKANIASFGTIWVETSSPFPHSRAAQHDKVLRLAEQGVLKDPTEILDKLDMGIPEGFGKGISLDALQAAKENDVMRRGGTGGYVPVEEWDDHQIHVRSHDEYRKFPWFRTLDDKVKNTFKIHVDAHRKYIEQAHQALLQEQMQMQQAGVKPQGGQA